MPTSASQFIVLEQLADLVAALLVTGAVLALLAFGALAFGRFVAWRRGRRFAVPAAVTVSGVIVVLSHAAPEIGWPLLVVGLGLLAAAFSPPPLEMPPGEMPSRSSNGDRPASSRHDRQHPVRLVERRTVRPPLLG
jgi:hypothetical protein